MTEEEIRPIAEDYVEEYCHCPDGEYTDGSLVCAGIGTALIVSRQLEKRIAKLEKENAELKEELTKKADTNHSLVVQMADLESENAELKEQCSILADCNTCVSDCKTENIEIKKQLTKAKEILQEFVEWATWQGSNCPNFKSIQDKAEQFLSEVEK